MNDHITQSMLLAEILRLQRWAAGPSVPADQIFGLMHGFETVLQQISTDYGISAQVQERVEELLDEIETNERSPAGADLRATLQAEGIPELSAFRVLVLCRLQGRYEDALEKIDTAEGSIFPSLKKLRLPEQEWRGSLHYMELIDSSKEDRPKMYAVFSPTVPRVGEVITPEAGSPMEVVGVEYNVITEEQSEGDAQHVLIPFVYLDTIDDE